MEENSKNLNRAPEDYSKGDETSEQERRKLTEDLRRVQARLASALEAGLAGTFYWDIERDRVTTDENMRSVFSLSDAATSAEGVPLAEVLPAIDEADRSLVEKALTEAIESTSVYQIEYRVNHSDGTTRWLSARGTIERDRQGKAVGLSGFAVDITERKRAEIVARESEQRLRLVTDSTPALISYVDADLHYRFVNQHYTDWFQIAPEEIVGRHVREIIGEAAFAAVLPEMRRALAGEAVTYERLMPYKTAGSRHVEVKFAPDYDEESRRVRGFYALVVDISERQAREANQKFLFEIAEIIRRAATAEDLIYAATEAVGRHLGVSRSLFMEIELEKDAATIHKDFYAENSRSLAGEIQISRFSPGSIEIMRGGRTLVNDDIKNNPRTAAFYETGYKPLEMEAFVGVPLMRGGRWIAALAVVQNEARHWTAEEINLLETVAERAWLAVEKLRGEAALRESAEVTRLAMDSANVYSWQFDLEAGKAAFSGNVSEVVGFALPENFDELTECIHPEDRQSVKDVLQKTFAAKSDYEHETRYVNPNTREIVWLRTQGAFLPDAKNQPTRFVGITQNIAESKRRQLNTEFLAVLGEDLARISNPNEIMRVTAEKIGKFFDVSRCVFVEYDLPNDAASVIYEWNADGKPDLIGDYKMSEYVTEDFAAALSSGKQFVVDDSANNAGISAENIWRLGVGAFVNTPYLSDGRWKASLTVNSRAARRWRTDELELLRDAATRIWTRLERARAEEKLRRAARFDAFRVRLADALRPLSDAAEIQLATGRILGEELSANRVVYFEVRGENYFVERDYTNDAAPLAGGFSIESFGERLLAAYRSGQAVWSADVAADEELSKDERAAYATVQIGAYVSVPLVKNGEFVAGLGVHTREPQDWTADDIRLVEEAAERTWAAVTRARAEEALAKSEEKYRALFNSMDEGFTVLEMIFDESGKPVDYLHLENNPAQQRMTGMPDVTGRRVREAIPDIEDFWIETFGRVAVTGEAVRFENYLEGLDRWFDVFASRIGGAGSRQVALIYNDITNRKLAEQERERLLEREQELRRAAETANRLKDEFLATVSHELRTPLNAILGWSSMLQSGKATEEIRQRADETIYRSAKSQAQLIEDLLDVSRIITGKMRLEARPAHLSAIVESAINTLRPAAQAKSIRLETILNDGESCVITGDAQRLQQIVWNLISNAVKFTPEGGQVEVKLESGDSYARLIVSDTGKGIEPEFLPFMFERFRQEDGSTTRRHGGLGLGLAIVRHLVELHGGKISATSAGLNQGSTFTIELPLLSPDVHAKDSSNGKLKNLRESLSDGFSEEKKSARQLTDINVLLVDDELDTLELLDAALTAEGASVRVASSAVDAFEIFQDWKPDVIISDIAMPDEDGYSLIKRVRELSPDAGGRTPAIAMTAYVRVEDRMRVLKYGFQMYVPKPAEPFELTTAINNLVADKKSN